MNNVNIEELAEFLADEEQFPAVKGYRKVDSPAFIFFDDERDEDEDLKWGRAMLQDFEEWVAQRNHSEILDKRLEEKAVIRKVTVAPHRSPGLHSLPGTRGCGYKPTPTLQDIKRASYLKRKPKLVPATITEIVDDYEHQEDLNAVYELVTYENLERDQAAGVEPVVKTRRFIDFHEMQQIQARNRWTIHFHKRLMERGNDIWHAIKKDIGMSLSERAEAASGTLHGKIASRGYKELVTALRERMKYAPGPVDGTWFINPDGTKHKARDNNPLSAKAAYAKRHKLEDEFVSVDRVQKEGAKTSQWVVGTRRTSDVVMSNYYDPSPAFSERKRNGEWVKEYDPGERNLYMVTPSTVMPFGSHRLTIREFERAIIAGSSTMDDEEEGYADSLSRDYVADYRQRAINMGKGSAIRDEASLSHQEAYLYGIFRLFEQEEACELMLLQDQADEALHNHFMHKGQYTDELIDILKKVADDDCSRKTPDGRILPPANEERMLPWVTRILCGKENAQEVERMVVEAVIPLFDVDYSIPTGTAGECRIASWLKWS